MELNIWQIPAIEMNSKGKQMIPNNEVILENDQVEKIRLFKSTFETKISTLEKISHNSKSLLLMIKLHQSNFSMFLRSLLRINDVYIEGICFLKKESWKISDNKNT